MFSKLLCLAKAIISPQLVLFCKCSLEFFSYPVLEKLQVELCLDKAGVGAYSLTLRLHFSLSPGFSFMTGRLCGAKFSLVMEMVGMAKLRGGRSYRSALNRH